LDGITRDLADKANKPWQEVEASNPFAPTNLFKNFHTISGFSIYRAVGDFVDD